MHRVDLKDGADLDGFRRALRGLVALGVGPDAVEWSVGAAPSLFGDTAPLPADAPPVSLPRPVGTLIEGVVCHRDPERYALLHRLVWRVLRGERDMLDHHADPLVHRLALLDKAVRRDLHKMHAFLRFHEVRAPDGTERYVAWFEPDHFIVEATAPFFVERFESLVWTILTPVGSLHWDRRSLSVGPAAFKPEGLDRDDRFAEGWQRYYESTFNPARVNPTAMRAEMPRKYWANLPEAAAIPGMIRSAPARVQAMIEAEAAAPRRRDPAKAVAAMARQEPTTLAELNRIIRGADPLVPGATQAVPGEGPEGDAIAIVGEQPGIEDDASGRPFQGDQGRLLAAMLAAARLPQGESAYLTHVVKCRAVGGREPSAQDIAACLPWLRRQIALLRPRWILALGRVAAQAVIGTDADLDALRGGPHRHVPGQGEPIPVWVTHPPASLLVRSAWKAEAWRDLAGLAAAVREAEAAAPRNGD